MARRPKHAGILIVPLVLMIVALWSWVGFGGDLIARFDGFDTEKIAQEEMRLKNWSDTFPATREMGIFGAGLGSYHGVHRLYRTDREFKVFRFAENQYFQAWVEAGWPGLLLYLSAWMIGWSYVMLLVYRGTSPSTIATGVFGIFLLVSQGIASFFDFGFYIPANMLLLSLLVGFVGFHAHSLAFRLRKKTWLRFQMPNRLVQVVLLVVFAGITVATIDFYRKWQLDKAMSIRLTDADFESLDIAATDEAINAVTDWVSQTKSVAGLNYLGDLRVHRARLQFLDELMLLASAQLLDEESRINAKREFWNDTRLSNMHESFYFLKSNISQYSASQFLQAKFVLENLPLALRYYRLSRELAPLQPEAHKQIGKITALIGTSNEAEREFGRAIELAPTNAELRLTAGLFLIQSGKQPEASEQLKRYLSLEPKGFRKLMQVLIGQSNRRIARVNEETIFESIIPDDPKMLYEFAQIFMSRESPTRIKVLEKADLLLGEVSLADPENLLLSARIKLAKGDMAGGIEQFELALRSDPGDQKTKVNLVRLYLKAGMLDKARKIADELYRLNRRNESYEELLAEVDEAIKKSRQENPQ